MSDLVYCRGKRENGGWVYGYAVKKAYHNGYYIITHASSSDRVNATGLVSGAWKGYEDIIPETIGRDTGLTDKNGTKIFDGDIVNAAIETEWCDEQGYRAEIETMTGIVQWDRFSACWMIRGIENGHIAFCDMISTEAHLFEVIGNIHDNKPLVEAMKRGDRI